MLHGRKWVFPIYTLVLLAFTAYVLLNTFAVSRIYTVVQEPEVATETAEETEGAEPIVTESLYEDGNISITLSNYRIDDTDG